MPVMNRSGLLSKAGLRRLLSSDEVWTLGKKRNQVEFVPVEQESNNPPTSSSYRYSRQNQAPLHLFSPKRITETEGGSTSRQCDAANALTSGPNEQDSQDTTPIRERPQHPAQTTMKPVLNIQHFALNREPDSCRAPIMSNLPSDKKEDLRLNSKKSHHKPKEQEDLKMTNVVNGSATPDTTALNVQNNQRLHSVLALNNNHNIFDQDPVEHWKSCLSYSKPDKSDDFPEQKVQARTNETVTDNPLIENLILEAVSAEIRKAEDSPSCDVSLSEIDEKSEAISFHSEALAWSEEEKDLLDEEKNEAPHASSGSLVFAEKYTVVQEDFQLYLKNKQDGRSHYERQPTVESTLSEILSPVDEVLSYGSAELPPFVKGGGLDSYSCPPPPPAFEIITWTSEDELPAPPDSVEDLSINSENLPPLPVDVSLKRRESQSLGSGSLREKEGSDDTNGALHEYANENDCSEHTSSLPEDVRNEILDPLSSFHVGDRVLVCNSRQGVLKYKGLTAFANGFWAGVALDAPNGNHNGTFRGVKYFTCDKSYGILVRAEDIAHIPSSDVETRMDKVPFSDEELSGVKRDKQLKDTLLLEGQRGHSQCPPKDETKPTITTCSQQKYPQEDTSDSVRNLSRPLGIISPTTDFELHHNGQNGDHVDAKLTEELDKDGVHCSQEIRKRQRMTLLHGSQSTDTDARKGEDFMPCVLEQWHPPQPETPPKIKVPPHEDAIVYRLVDASVEILCSQSNENTLDFHETPSYLLDDGGRKHYRQVIFQLTSEVLHEILGDLLWSKQSAQNIHEQSVISALQLSKISVSFLKAAVRKDIQNILNLERSDQQMTEMLQKLCKYWYAKRDRVDFILIQELHNEERSWLDYRADQYTVKMHLTEEIFKLLLDDTILALNHMHF